MRVPSGMPMDDEVERLFETTEYVRNLPKEKSLLFKLLLIWIGRFK